MFIIGGVGGALILTVAAVVLMEKKGRKANLNSEMVSVQPKSAIKL
jgi:hypothetical protein